MTSKEKASVSPMLEDWHDFYILLGTAAAALVALLFVAASIGASMLTPERTRATRTYLSLVVFHCGDPVLPASSRSFQRKRRFGSASASAASRSSACSILSASGCSATTSQTSPTLRLWRLPGRRLRSSADFRMPVQKPVRGGGQRGGRRFHGASGG
jgi:hypothetical protein